MTNIESDSFDRYLLGNPNIRILDEFIEDDADLESAFLRVFSCEGARMARKIVYFYLAARPIPRLRGESRVLYIGKTTASFHSRYARYASRLAAGSNGAFYAYVINTFGPISFAYCESLDPRSDEARYFQQYRAAHLEFPPKSKVG